MNLFLVVTIIFVIIYLFLNWFAKSSSKKIAQFLKRLALLLSVALATLLGVVGKYIFSLPFLFSFTISNFASGLIPSSQIVISWSSNLSISLNTCF